jgi:hypothetical protein
MRPGFLLVPVVPGVSRTVARSVATIHLLGRLLEKILEYEEVQAKWREAKNHDMRQCF